MFCISLRVSVKIGDTADCRINGEPRKVTWRDDKTLVIEPGDARTIIDVHGDGKLRFFTCGNAVADGGTDGITIIRPEVI